MYENYYVTSDTHLFHYNIIEYDNAPYASIKEMANDIVLKWNSTVPKSAKVLHLGDVTFGNKELTTNIIKKLNGEIILIKGNHDRRHSSNFYLDCGFSKVYDHPTIMFGNIIFSHKPLEINYGDLWNIHGHIHTAPAPSKKHFNAGIMTNDYKPYNLKSIVKELKNGNK